MNEQTKLLAEKAGFVLWGDEPWNPGDVIDWSCRYDDEFKNLVEMIVLECVGVVENLSPGYDDYRNQIEDAFRRDCVEQLKQHFSIKNPA